MAASRKERNALVVEGGGMRGIFAAGVLDAFLEQGFDPFDLYIGVSAGACNLASHLAGQHRRNYRVYTRFMTRKTFFDFARFLRGGHWMDLDWLWDALDREDPLDVHGAVRNHRRELRITVTDATSGRPMYLRPDASGLNHCLKASCAIPVMYRGPIEVDSVPVVDGGVADSIPVSEACRRGAGRIMVIRSRPAGYVQKRRLAETAFSLPLLRHPRLWGAAFNRTESYMRAVQFIARPPDGVRVIQVAPPGPLSTGRTTRDPVRLEDDYRLGRIRGSAAIRLWQSFFGSEPPEKADSAASAR